MGATVRRNNKGPGRVVNRSGFTLIEVLVALVVLSLGMLASLIGVMGALNHNMLNELRGEAIQIAQQQAESVRNAPYATIAGYAGTTRTQNIQEQVRNALITYTVSTNYSQSTGSQGYNSSLVTFTVSWNTKYGKQIQTFQYVSSTIVGQNQ